MAERYNPQKIEKKWQDIWIKKQYSFWRAENPPTKGEKFYLLDMFPYPSGEGLHVGHVENYTASDIYARYLRMKGYNVLHPMGWDAFGLPAENYAIKTRTYPEIVVSKNIKRFKNQIQRLGLSFDWSREINTTDPNYYKWTQWIFLQLFKNGLVYHQEAPVNWCLGCKTVLANEESVEGKCERCGGDVIRKNLKQWFLKITAYADRLLKDLEGLDWPVNVKQMQRNWIGKSEGYEVGFRVSGKPFKIKVFTTRIDTLFGATFLVLSPEHPLVNQLTSSIQRYSVEKYLAEVKTRSERERSALVDKTGIFTGSYAINPATKEEIPIWVSDYVLMNYGTGAIMSVPAHDKRDFDFAKKFNLPIRQVVGSPSQISRGEIWEGEGILINSGPFSNLDSAQSREKIAIYVNAQKTISYKLRDWVFSRQRYWGEPIPLIFCENCHKKLKGISNSQFSISKQIPNSKTINYKLQTTNYSLGEILNPGWIALDEKDLPLKLPKVKYYEPTGEPESPLARITNWVNTKCPKCGGSAKRETNTMPQWAGSNWYYIGYLIAENSKSQIPISKQIQNSKFKKITKYWLFPKGVDLYIGGVEHAVLHLLYARFWHKFLYDISIMQTIEPFQKLINQGLILGPDGEKMSKSRGNVINPDDIVRQYGADTLRMYEMFLGPLEDVKPWKPEGIIGIFRFLNRVWNLGEARIKNKELRIKKSKIKSRATNHKLQITRLSKKELKGFEVLHHKTIKKVTEDIESFKFNTAISSLMEYQNAISFIADKMDKKVFKKYFSEFLVLLFPFAPHISQEIYFEIGAKKTLDKITWPKYNPRMLEQKEVEIIIQINGKLRDKIKTAKIPKDNLSAQKFALTSKRIKKIIGRHKIRRIIYKPPKLINLVI